MSAPIEISFRVDCEPDHAWTTWTERIGTWWPPGHSRSGGPGLRMAIEPGVGGRIVERTPAGDEHVWGEVTAGDPPARLAYLWHIWRTRARPCAGATRRHGHACCPASARPARPR